MLEPSSPQTIILGYMFYMLIANNFSYNAKKMASFLILKYILQLSQKTSKSKILYLVKIISQCQNIEITIRYTLNA